MRIKDRNDKLFGIGKNISDVSVYLNENRYDTPKEYFKVLGKILSKANYPQGSKLLDVGCASGELLYYLKRVLPEFKELAGMDISRDLIKKAIRYVSGAKFFVSSINNSKFFRKHQYDAVICCGVISIFDNFSRPLGNLLSCVREGGMVLVFGIFNDDPVDVIIRYRVVNQPQRVWKAGLNVFSRHSIDRLLTNSRYQLKWEWLPFRMPFAIEKNQQTPIRAWTIKTEYDPYQQVAGTSQLLNTKILKIKIIKVR